MPLKGGVASDSDVRSTGRFVLDLIKRPDWVKRRVETIAVLDEIHVERRVTIDIDGAELDRRARRFRVQRSSGRVPVPVVALRKALQLDIDLRDAEDRPLPVAVSDEDSHLAHAMLLASIREAGIPARRLSPSVRDLLYALCRQRSIDLLLDIVEQVASEGTFVPRDPANTVAAADLSTWEDLLGPDDVFNLISDLTQSYLLVTEIRPSAETIIIKHRRVDSRATVWPRNPFRTLGMLPVVVEIDAPGIGTAQREHTRVISPPGSVAVRARLLALAVETGEYAELGADEYERREDADRVAIYTDSIPRGEHQVRVMLRPRRSAFLVPAFLGHLFTLGLIAAGYWLELGDCRFSRGTTDADAAVAILALIPSLSTIYFVQHGEHRLVARLHLAPRLMSIAVVAVTLIAAGAIAVSATHESLLFVFRFAFVANALSVLVLAISIAAITVAIQRIGSRRV